MRKALRREPGFRHGPSQFGHSGHRVEGDEVVRRCFGQVRFEARLVFDGHLVVAADHVEDGLVVLDRM